ncbi:MAG: DUF1674 domain-containing protein [Rhodobiaceae bacterium]|nr:DUF1674 domain-containing protein [Rhodobiaceae bacterium]MCC0012539.1 DUF1674 domain-containing protein [Rhodobiaceae bacterium]MCC0061746.1 DUF1674 domain-containing protein [Rhodobiaceae bacterium]
MNSADEKKKRIADAAERAKAEAAERRKQRDASAKPAAQEINGRDGPEPVRYGDWEVGGIATDF